MYSSRQPLWLAVVALFAVRVLADRVELAPSTSQFQQWYPQYAYVFETILHQNCSKEYGNYLTGVRNESEIDRVGGGSLRSALTQPVISCILTSTGEYVKAQLAASQVLLGVAPTILALMGPSVEETATFLLVSRRPLLFLLIILSSPSVFFSRAFEYSDPIKALEDHPLRLVRRRPKGWFRTLVTVAQYVIALASVANIAMVSYDLGIKTICVFLSVWTFSPLVWAILGIVIHMMGVFTLRMRVRRLHDDELRSPEGMAAKVEDITLMQWLRRMPQRISQWIDNEPRLSGCQTGVQLVVFPESSMYIIAAWILSACTITHILFGTLLFSSTLFIGPEDAVGIIVRYVVSVMACRAVLMFELSGLQDSFRRSNEAASTSQTIQKFPGGEYVERDGLAQMESSSDGKGDYSSQFSRPVFNS